MLDPLQETSWAALFHAMVPRQSIALATRPGFAVGIVLTTPPFPYTRKQVAAAVGLPVLLPPDLSVEGGGHIHCGEVGMQGEQLVTSGIYGWTLVATGAAATIAEAREKAYRLAGAIHAPNLRYRLDIGDRLIAGEFDVVEGLGLLDSPVDASVP